MKKLLYTSFSGFPTPDTGGPNKVIHQLMQNIDLDKFNVSFLSKHSNFQYSKEDKKKSIQNKISFKPQLTSKLFNKSNFYRSIVTNPFYLRYHYYKASKFFSSKKEYINTFDIIHAHDPRALVYFDRSRAKKILTIHTKGSILLDLQNHLSNYQKPNILFRQIREMERKAIIIADFVTFPSNAAKDLYLYDLDLQKNSKFLTIYNGINIDQIDEVEIDYSLLNKFSLSNKFDIKLLNVAEHIKVKNIESIINIVHLLKNEHNLNPLFVNIGKGPDTQHLRNLIRKYNLENNVKLLGVLKNEDVLSLMKWFDIFIILSERVIFDMVVLEALASNMTVVASNEGGNKEIISNNQNGYLVNPDDLHAISKVILSYKETNKSLIRDSLLNFSLNNITRKYEELYE